MNPKYIAQARKVFPFLRWRHRVTRETLGADLIAGLTGAALVLPQGVAFAVIAGMPPEYGLYASMVPAIIAALFGSSWHLVSGPTTAASIVMFSALSAHANPGSGVYIVLAITLTFMVGVIQLAMGLARMGALVNFISHSVIVGFTAGAGILIATKQAGNFFGLELPSGSGVLRNTALSLESLDGHSPAGLVDGAAHARYRCRGQVEVAQGAGPARGPDRRQPRRRVAEFLLVSEPQYGISMVGALPRQLPPLSMPVFSVAVFRDLAPAALAMTLFALTEAVSIARSISMRSGQAIDGNQEFIGQGLSNIAGSFFSAYVATGSFNRSGANYDAGAKTPLAAVFAGILLVIVVLLFAPITAYLPHAAMAGLLVLVAWRLIDFHQIRSIIRSDRKETLVMAVTFFGALFLELEFAISAGRDAVADDLPQTYFPAPGGAPSPGPRLAAP